MQCIFEIVRRCVVWPTLLSCYGKMGACSGHRNRDRNAGLLAGNDGR